MTIIALKKKRRTDSHISAKNQNCQKERKRFRPSKNARGRSSGRTWPWTETKQLTSFPGRGADGLEWSATSWRRKDGGARFQQEDEPVSCTVFGQRHSLTTIGFGLRWWSCGCCRQTWKQKTWHLKSVKAEECPPRLGLEVKQGTVCPPMTTQVCVCEGIQLIFISK